VAPDDPDAIAVVGRRAVGSGAVATPLGSTAEGRVAQPMGPRNIIERHRQTASRRAVDAPFEGDRATGDYGRIAEPMEAVPEPDQHQPGSVPLVRTTHAFAAVVPPDDLSLDDEAD